MANTTLKCIQFLHNYDNYTKLTNKHIKHYKTMSQIKHSYFKLQIIN